MKLLNEECCLEIQKVYIYGKIIAMDYIANSLTNSKSQVLLYLIKNLTDENIGKLICHIYDKKIFYNPYKTNREMFINILLGNIDQIKSIDDEGSFLNIIKLHKAIFETGDKEYSRNNYYIIWDFCKKYKFTKFDLGEISIKNSEIINDDMLIDMIKFCKSKCLPIDDYCGNFNPFKDYIFDIIKAIISFDIRFKDRYLGNYKQLLNNVIKRIIDTGYFYKISNTEDEYHNTLFCLALLQFPHIINNEYEIKETRKFKLIEKPKGLYIKGDIEDFKIKGINSILYKEGSPKSLVGSFVTESFERKLKCIDDAIKEYGQKITKCQMCHREHIGTQRCKECRKILNIILNESKSTFGNIKRIEYKIERKTKIEDFKSEKESKTFRYNNLINLLRNVKISDAKNEKRLGELINITFGDIKPFEF